MPVRKNLVVGILPESKNQWEKRAPLTPRDVAWLVSCGISVEVIDSPLRVFKRENYQKAGATIVKRFRKASLILGIKEPNSSDLIPGKIYCVFSHTTKGQKFNQPLLKAFVKKKTTLIDFEHIQDRNGSRLAYFGRFAGICGAIDSLHFLGRRWKALGYSTPLLKLKRTLDYGSLSQAEDDLERVERSIRRTGFPKAISPFIIGITGHGNVSKGIEEVLNFFKPVEIHPDDVLKFVKHEKKSGHQVYKIVFNREEKLRAKDRGGFYFEEYLEHPDRFESNLDHYLPYLGLLMHASFWSAKYPRLVTEQMIRKLYQKKQKSKLALIGDISCDVNGAIEITKRVTNPNEPVFIYHPVTKKIQKGWEGEGVVVLAVDNLPCELPKESSEEFSSMIRDYVYQIAAHGVFDLTNHHALPFEIRNAVICQGGRLTKAFSYLKKYL